jgi:hypothetical protein
MTKYSKYGGINPIHQKKKGKERKLKRSLYRIDNNFTK